MVYSEAHPVGLLQQVQEYLMDRDITPIINNEEWTVAYQVPMKLEAEDLETALDLNVRLDFQRVGEEERVAVVFSSRDQCAGKWLL